MNKKIVFLLMSFMLLLYSIQSYAAVGVRPLVLDIDIKPGGSRAFELTLLAAETQDLVNIDFYQPIQETNGKLTYKRADADTFPSLNWVNLETNQIIVPPGENTIVKGEVNVPYDARGSHTVIMMVEPARSESKQGISFKVRYAVRVNINIESIGLREDLEVLDFDLETNKDGEPILFAKLKNTSLLRYKAEAEISLRDKKRQLLERAALFSEAAAANNKNTTTLYPGSEVHYTGKVNEAIFPGEYMLQLDARYGDGRRVIKRKDISVGKEFLQQGKIQYLEITPDLVQDTLKPGGVNTQLVDLRNRTGDPLSVEIKGKEIEPGYEHSVFSGLDFQLRGEKEFDIPPRRSGRAVVITRVPRDIKPGGYYGFLEIGVFSSGNLLERKQINIDMLIGDEWEYKAEVLSIDDENFENEHIFSIGLKNTGETHITPTGKLQLKDETGEIIKTLGLKMEEDEERILPDKIGYLSTTTDNIEPGKYSAELTINYQNTEITRKVLSLNLE